jgi:ADP-L-glycero-D-manno-heptose 6-epimerase
MSEQSNKIVVTGAAGFIGSNLVQALNLRGLQSLYVVDQLDYERKKTHLQNLKYERYFGKNEFLTILPELTGIETIIHLGACTDTTVQDEQYFRENNTQYSKVLFDYCVRAGSRFIYGSSAATYGDGSQGFSDQARRFTPLNLYGYSKYWFDEMVLDSRQKPGQWVGLKFFNVYGPNEGHKGKMASLICQGYEQIKQTGKMRLFKSSQPGLADGGEKRDFVYAKDVLKVIMFFLDNPQHSGIFNVGTGKARSFLDLGKALFASLNREPNLEFFEMPREIRQKYQYFTQADVSSLRRAGYSEAFLELEDGINDYVKNYLNV